MKSSGMVRTLIMLLIAATAVMVFIAHTGNRPIRAPEVIGLAEFLAFTVPLLWLNNVRRWGMILLSLPLIWLGFTALQCWMRHERFYAICFAANCVACTTLLVWKLRQQRAGGPGPNDRI